MTPEVQALITKGSVVQVNPENKVNPLFAACMVIVDEVKSFGIQGYVQVPGKGQAYIRLGWDDIEYIGEAIWDVK